MNQTCLSIIFSVAPLHLLSLQSHSASLQGASIAETSREDGMVFLHPTNQMHAEQTFHQVLSAKRRRWESAGSESPLGSGMAPLYPTNASQVA